MQINEIIKHYKETKDEDYFNRIVHYFDKELNKISWKVLGRIDEDIKQEFYLELYTKILPKDIDNFKSYICGSAYMFFRKKYMRNCLFPEMKEREKYKMINLYYKNDKNIEEIEELKSLQSQIIQHVNLNYDDDIGVHSINDDVFEYDIFDTAKKILTEEEYFFVEEYFKNGKSYRAIGLQIKKSHEVVGRKIKNIIKKLQEEIVKD